MALTSSLLASGSDWRVDDVVCSSGPRDRPFEERHDWACVALTPGALLLGNSQHCFECGHEHAVGDRCLSFHFAPEFLENVAVAAPGVRRLAFTVPRLPPIPALLPIIAAAEAAHRGAAETEFEELALRLAGAVSITLSGARAKIRAPSRRDERRITPVLRRIEAEADEPLSLANLARTAAMSPYHFLRTFRAVVGVTPHQFILHTRLQRTALRLRGTTDNVSDIAFAAGFGDLSTFNRRFRRLMGTSPSAYRAAPLRATAISPTDR
jgi:AraC family transcriptional regulator